MTRSARAGGEVDETELRFRNIHGYRRAHRMMGSGPALLLLHGIGDSSEGWRPLLPALAEHFTVIAPDLFDAAEVQRVFDGLPDGPARGAFTRTLRSVVDWRGQVVTMLDRSYLAAGMPVLLVWGTLDAVIPIRHGHLAHAAMAGSRLEIYPDAGHFPHHADPDRFVADLRDFVSTTEPAEHDPSKRKELLDQGGWRPPTEPDPFRWTGADVDEAFIDIR